MTIREKDIFNFLKQIAMEDGVIRIDETQIISHAMRSAISFDWYLEEARKDGIIDEEERKKLDTLRQKIYEDAQKIAKRDDLVSHEEAVLLSKLADKLKEYRDYEDIDV